MSNKQDKVQGWATLFLLSVIAWYTYHNVTITDKTNDTLIEMVTNNSTEHSAIRGEIHTNTNNQLIKDQNQDIKILENRNKIKELQESRE